MLDNLIVSSVKHPIYYYKPVACHEIINETHTHKLLFEQYEPSKPENTKAWMDLKSEQSCHESIVVNKSLQTI